LLKIDLHLHSAFSDGTLSSAELVRLLAKGGVSVASLTDHDTTEGVASFMAACRGKSIRAVSGVEISAAHDGVLHLLGFRFDVSNVPLENALKKNRSARNERNIRICEKLRDAGFDVTLEEVRALAGSDVIGRPHMAQLLVNKGYLPNVRAAFDRYLKRGGAAYVPRPLLAPDECIRLIREGGGLPVMAHPLQTTPDLDDLPPLLAKLKEFGLWGLECQAAGSSPAGVYRCLGIAARLGLQPTAGSDFHGGGHASAGVGVVVGEDFLPWARFCGGL
jgi:predicted metal-dependent phosphoesterase TrpH